MQYTLIFDKKDKVPFYAKYLKYTHVALIQHGENGIDIGIDAKKSKIVISAQNNIVPKKGLESITFFRDLPENIDLRCPCLCTCVSFIKKILGIKCWWMITPNQLLDYIILSHDVNYKYNLKG